MCLSVALAAAPAAERIVVDLRQTASGSV